MTRDDVHLLSGAYALDAVTAEEAALVERAMEHSEELRSEVVGLTDTAVALGLGLAPVAPPAALRGRLLDAIGSLPQEQPEPESADDLALDVPAASPVGEHVAPRRRRRRRSAVLLAVAAAVVVAFSGGFLVNRVLLEPQAQYAAIGGASDAREVSARMADGGTAKVTWSASEHGTVVVLTGAKVPSGKVLQLWSIRGGTVTSAGLYDQGQHWVLLSGAPVSGEVLAVSVEPAGGSTQPTTKPVVEIPLRT